MTSRELALTALNHKETERLPWTLYLAAPLAEKLEQRWGPREKWPCPPDDLIRILWEVEVNDISPSGL